MKYKVIKEHWSGGKRAVGDVVEAEPRDVAHLIGTRLKPIKRKKTDGDS